MDCEVHPQVEAVAAEIATMEVRGATTIAETAANALRVQAQESEAVDPETFRAELRAAGRVLVETRPSAVSLPNAVRLVLSGMDGGTVDELRGSVVDAASDLCDRLATAQAELGAIGAKRLADGDTIVTHCHSTDVLACVEAARDQGKRIDAYVKETRPRQQGHITAQALQDLGVSTTLMVDGAARRYLADADHVFIGADSVTADGSVVNKIGTSGLAVLADERDVPVTVAAQTIKFHPGASDETAVDIEHRDAAEVLDETAHADLENVDVVNPAFDVTPPEYVDVIVTERGQITPGEVEALIRAVYDGVPMRPWEASTTSAAAASEVADDATESP